ncbi:hypothetical protein POL82_04245 [Priestia aryabhattai]|uniref:hypothetical protein n=1 Tax=Priestia TaxID=2800373 RepID=UPI00234FA17E|nr:MULTISPECIES: hypothetical protein [Priestia]MDC7762659.1 hypothetical protein [Priestia aryabhattai]MED3980885.1 hypothetical protein [Priestia megaterium]
MLLIINELLQWVVITAGVIFALIGASLALKVNEKLLGKEDFEKVLREIKKDMSA